MRLLVTGGAGYLGAVLVPMLLEEDHEVTVVDNFLYGQTPLLDCCHYQGLQVVRGDARDRGLITDCLNSVDAILPLACLTGAPLCERDPLEAKSVNLDAIQMLLELRKPGQLMIFPTTNSGYGIGQDGIYCTEETPLRPLSTYARLKVEAEQRVLEADDSLTLRLATVFGISPRMRLDLLVNDFVYRAVTEGSIVLYEGHFKRNYIHVRDVSRAFLHALRNFDTMKAESYNVGLSDANLSKRELCEEIRKQVPDLSIVECDTEEDPDKRNYIVSNAKIERTGYKPTISLQAGIAELMKGYQVIARRSLANA